jgi:hypothetical protein
MRVPRTGKYGPLWDKLEAYWVIKVRPKLNFVLAIITGALAIVIVFSECTLAFTGAYGRFTYEYLVRPIVGMNYTLSMVSHPAMP